MCIENEHIYDGFEHLGRALFWEPDAPIVMLTFYADDANKSHQHDYIHVAGWIGLAAQWDTFSIDWRLRLAKAGLTEFHASEFFYWQRPIRRLEQQGTRRRKKESSARSYSDCGSRRALQFYLYRPRSWLADRQSGILFRGTLLTTISAGGSYHRQDGTKLVGSSRQQG